MERLISDAVGVPRDRSPLAPVLGEERFQELLMQGMEIEAQSTFLFRWWSNRVLYLAPDANGQAALVVSRTRHDTAGGKSRHLCVSDMTLIALREDGGGRIVTIACRGLDRGGVTLRFPTPRAARIFSKHLTAMLEVMGLGRPGANGQGPGGLMRQPPRRCRPAICARAEDPPPPRPQGLQACTPRIPVPMCGNLGLLWIPALPR
jgi:hypothetical protein